jgi:hypothetical protein
VWQLFRRYQNVAPDIVLSFFSKERFAFSADKVAEQEKLSTV